jgi:aspartate 4-decarboxylase
VSLANLNEPDYVRIGATLQRLLEEYHQRWLQETGQA